MSSKPQLTEFTKANEWVAKWFEPDAGGKEAPLPLSFRYGGKPSAEWMSAWQAERERKDAGPDATLHTLRFRDTSSGLVCRCEVTVFRDFPAIEWVAYFRNDGKSDTPIVEDIQALDATLAVDPKVICSLHHARGSVGPGQRDDFAPIESLLAAVSVPSPGVRLGSFGGRSSQGALPFFNLEMDKGGVIGAVGWTGNWSATFSRSQTGDIGVRAGMQATHLRLHPGEEIRTPRMLLLFWEGDRQHGHNMLRQFILAHHTPRPNGKLLSAPACYAVWGENTEKRQIAKARWLRDHDIPVDLFWMDAGWYGDGPYQEDADVFNSQWGPRSGDWWPNKNMYPNGMKPVGDALREMGLGFVLWFDAERAATTCRTAAEHTDRFLAAPGYPNLLVNLGKPEVRRAFTDTISKVIAEGGVTCYRQDFNMDPEPYWKAADAPDRIGMAEIRHIEGLYAFWDELLDRHPGLIIDNCASGGRRIDLETISRSIPLWRSDFPCYPGFDPDAIQAETHGLAMWVPLSTGCYDQGETYAFRSALGPGIVVVSALFGPNPPPPSFPADWLRERVAEQKEVGKYFYGDFYPLVSFSLHDDAWAVWQFDRPDLGEGMVLAFRRKTSPFAGATFQLRGLDPTATYAIEDRDCKTKTEQSGAELIRDGLKIAIGERPGSALFIYRRLG